MTVLAVFRVVLLLERQQRPQGELRDDRSLRNAQPRCGRAAQTPTICSVVSRRRGSRRRRRSPARRRTIGTPKPCFGRVQTSAARRCPQALRSSGFDVSRTRSRRCANQPETPSPRSSRAPPPSGPRCAMTDAIERAIARPCSVGSAPRPIHPQMPHIEAQPPCGAVRSLM